MPRGLKARQGVAKAASKKKQTETEKEKALLTRVIALEKANKDLDARLRKVELSIAAVAVTWGRK